MCYVGEDEDVEKLFVPIHFSAARPMVRLDRNLNSDTRKAHLRIWSHPDTDPDPACIYIYLYIYIYTTIVCFVQGIIKPQSGGEKMWSGCCCFSGTKIDFSLKFLLRKERQLKAVQSDNHSSRPYWAGKHLRRNDTSKPWGGRFYNSGRPRQVPLLSAKSRRPRLPSYTLLGLHLYLSWRHNTVIKHTPFSLITH